MIKLIGKENKLNYVVDILKVEIDFDTLTANIIDTAGTEYKIQYSNKKAFDILADDIDQSLSNGPSIDVYLDENDLINKINPGTSEVHIS